ncbi:MAG TPA: prolipoprotein diacylglyceryl transferase [Gemmatimonadales bacterium]|jgi:phosphatidylglycerol:prolipoprotein diacylglycerol transferase|nr:prolipoprotein diacylglyceryl transferase [Gemmatimonadales bacterium]
MTVYPFTIELPFCLGIPSVFCIREITGFGLMMMVAFLMAGWAVQLELRRRQMNEDYAADIVLAAVIGGIVGAKLWFVLLTGASPLQRGGFVWYGGFLGGVAAVLLTGWRKGVPARWTCELTATALPLGHALGRVGCFLVNDDYGIPSALPWAMKFPAGLPPTSVANLEAMHVTFPPGTNPAEIVAVHPTELYETALLMLAFWWLWRLRDHGHGVGWRFGVYLVLAGAERFLVEFVRAKDDRLLGPFTLAQATSLGLVLAGFYLMQRWRSPETLEPALASVVPPALTGTTVAAAPPSR